MNLKSLLVVLALLATAWGVYDQSKVEHAGLASGSAPKQLLDSVHPTLPAPPVEATASAAGNPFADTERLANSLQGTNDLREVYERLRGSRVARERSMAYRAWSACFPAFLSANAGMSDVESLIANLPPNDPASSDRVDALRVLWGRCKRFSDLSHEQLLTETQRQNEAWMTGKAHSPGESAAKIHMDGNSAEALKLARAAVDSQDPYAIESLRDFVIHYWWDLNDNHPEQRVDRPDLRALAFYLAACNLGLACGPGSLTAVQQCASTGACTGNAVDRYLQGLPTQRDRDVVMEESRRVERAIRAKDYQALGLQ